MKKTIKLIVFIMLACFLFSSCATVKNEIGIDKNAKTVVKLSPEKAILINGKTFFPISVWQQPKYLFDYHKYLGINSILCPPAGENKKWYMDAAQEKGLYVIASYSADFKDHPAVIGWIEIINEDTGRVVKELEWLKKEDPDRLAYIHIGWDNVLNFKPEEEEHYRKVFGKADLTCCHVFPMGKKNPDGLHMVGDVVDFMNKYSDCRIAPMIDLECAKLEKGERLGDPPSKRQVRCEIWEAIIHGAKGLCYFTISFEPFVWSQVPAQNEDELVYNNRLIQELKDVILLGKDDVKVEKSMDEGMRLDIMPKRVGNELYIFAVNTARKEGNIKISVDKQRTVKELQKYEKREERKGEGRRAAKVEDKMELKDNCIEDRLIEYQVKIYKLQILN